MIQKFLPLLCAVIGLNAVSMAQKKRQPIWEAGLQYNLPADTLEIEVVKNINYQTEKNNFTTLDIYKPAGNKTIPPQPAVILIHGGPVSADIPVKPKDWKLYSDYGKLLASKGITAVVINHRIFDKENITQSRSDVLASITFIKANAGHYGLNSNSVGLWMFSLGGKHFDFFAQQKDSSVKAMISFYGVLSTERQTSDPTGYIPPQLIVRSGMDKPELLSVTDAYISKALQLNHPVEVVNHKNGVHAFDILQNSEQTIKLINSAIEFLKVNL